MQYEINVDEIFLHKKKKKKTGCFSTATAPHSNSPLKWMECVWY